MSPAVKPDLPSGTAALKPLAAALLICWVAAVIALSIVDYKAIPWIVLFKGRRISMAAHFLAYFAGAALFFWAFPRKHRSCVLMISFGIILLGVSLEIVQLFLPYRTYNPQDMLVNAAGVAACLAMYFYRR